MFAALVVLAATSCSKVEDKMQELIPDNAVAVGRLDVPKFIENSGVEMKDGKIEFPEYFVKTLKESGVKSSQIDDTAEKLADSGLDFSKPAYGFATEASLENEEDAFLGVFLMAIDDEKQLKAFLEEETDESFSEKDGMQYLQIDHERTSFVIDGDILIIGMSKNDVNPVKLVQKMKDQKENIKDNESAMKALDTSDDFNLWVNAKKVMEKMSGELERQMSYMPSSQQELMRALLSLTEAKAYALHATLADNEFKVKYEMDMSGNGDFEKLTEKVLGEPSAELLELMPAAKNMATFSVSLNGEGIADLDIVKKGINQIGLPEEDKNMLMSFVKSVNGPLTVGVASNGFNDEDYCVVYAVKASKSQEVLRKYGAQLDEAVQYGYAKKVGDEYQMEQGRDGTMAIGCKGDVLYLKMFTSTYDKKATSDSDAKSIIGSSKLSGLAKCTVAGMDGFLSVKAMSPVETSGIFYVKKGGEKMKPLDTVWFIYQLGKYMESDEFNKHRRSYSYDYDYNDYSSDFSEEDVAAAVAALEEEVDRAY